MSQAAVLGGEGCVERPAKQFGADILAKPDGDVLELVRAELKPVNSTPRTQIAAMAQLVLGLGTFGPATGSAFEPWFSHGGRQPRDRRGCDSRSGMRP